MHNVESKARMLIMLRVMLVFLYVGGTPWLRLPTRTLTLQRGHEALYWLPLVVQNACMHVHMDVQ